MCSFVLTLLFALVCAQQTNVLSTGRYVRIKADNGYYCGHYYRSGRNWMDCSKPRNDPTTKLEVYRENDNQVAFRAISNGMWLSRYSRSNGQFIEPVKAQRDPYSLFIIEVRPNGKLALKADNGAYWQHVYANANPIIASTTMMGVDCEFTVEPFAEIKSAVVTYQTDQVTFMELAPLFLESQSFVNGLQLPQTFRYSKTVTETFTCTWRWSWGITFGVSATVEAGLPGLVETKFTISIETTLNFGEEKTETKSSTFEIDQTVNLAPLSAARVNASRKQSRVDLPYFVTVTYVNETYQDRFNGIYNGVGYYHTDVVLSPIPYNVP